MDAGRRCCRASSAIPALSSSGLDKRLVKFDLGLWILTHSDLRRSARVRAFMEFAGAEMAKHRRSIEGAENEGASPTSPTGADFCDFRRVL